MAFAHGFVTWTIQDAKGAKSITQVNFPQDNTDGAHLDVLIDFAQTTAALIDDIIRGRIVSAGIGIAVDLSGVGLKASALASSDVEEGARFIWSTVDNTDPKFRLPTFDEDMLASGSRDVDLADPAVDAFVDRIIAGRTVGLTNVSPSDDHGSDITALSTARESFQTTRSG